MSHIDTLSTDTWEISLPNDWIDKGVTEEGAVYFESPDGAKGIYISTWQVPSADSPEQTMLSFKAVDRRSLERMDGYIWRIIAEETTVGVAVSCAVTDSLDEAKGYRIVGKILARPGVVVRAAFHDYNCSNYNWSQSYFAPIIHSLRLKDDEV